MAACPSGSLSNNFLKLNGKVNMNMNFVAAGFMPADKINTATLKVAPTKFCSKVSIRRRRTSGKAFQTF